MMIVSLVAADRAHAQGIERQSLAGEQAAGAAQGSDQNQPYNLMVGPVAVRASAGVSTTYNDNINIANTGRLHDVIITPNLDIGAVWQLTPVNSLTLDVGLGYEYYVMHSGTSALTVSPSSSTQFNIFVGDFKINVHDRFSYQQDPIQVGQLSNISQFSRFLNTAGLSVAWDLGDVILTTGYDHSNLWVYTSAYNYLTYETNSVYETVTFNVTRTITTGLTAQYTAMTYNQNIQNDNQTIQVGPFVTAQIDENLSFNASVGWEKGNFDQGGLNGDSSDIGSFYGSIGINHRINDVLHESLTGGQEYIPGINTNYTQRVYANYGLGYQVTQYLSSSINLWYENLNDSNGPQAQTSNRYGAGLDLNYNLTEKSSLSAGYQYVLKDCDQSQFSYYQNQVTVGFRYQF